MLQSVAVAQSVAGLRTVTSNYNAARTMNRLERVVRTAGLRVFSRIDYGREADRASIPLRPTQLLIFGWPEAGSTLMQADQRIGIDLPMRFLVWMDEAGKVNISWNDPAWLVQRHARIGHEATIESMRKAMERLARDAGG
jgi:uncharacterized protein (DUF302 family)